MDFVQRKSVKKTMQETKTQLSPFAKDVQEGLSQQPKAVSSKYFYDAKGDQIFQQIMHMPEYYLTDCEHEIFTEQYEHICNIFNAIDEPFNLIEFGAGDGYKTKILLKYLMEQNADFVYYPVDISLNILEELQISLRGMFPNLKMHPLHMDYFEAIKQLSTLKERRNITLFLGSNIGNFHFEQAVEFVTKMNKFSHPGDMLMIGIDLKKNPDIIKNAYDDPHGITAAFNMNLLSRMNSELDADIDLSQFKHFAHYDEPTGEMLSYIKSLQKQIVHFKAMDIEIQFSEDELIHTEISKKYSLNELELLAERCNYQIIEHFLDSRRYFTDTVWKCK